MMVLSGLSNSLDGTITDLSCMNIVLSSDMNKSSMITQLTPTNSLLLRLLSLLEMYKKCWRFSQMCALRYVECKIIVLLLAIDSLSSFYNFHPNILQFLLIKCILHILYHFGVSSFDKTELLILEHTVCVTTMH